MNRLQVDQSWSCGACPQCTEIRRRQQLPHRERTQDSQTQRCTRYCPLLLAGAARRLLAQLSQPQHRAPEPVSSARRLERRLSTGTASSIRVDNLTTFRAVQGRTVVVSDSTTTTRAPPAAQGRGYICISPNRGGGGCDVRVGGEGVVALINSGYLQLRVLDADRRPDHEGQPLRAAARRVRRGARHERLDGIHARVEQGHLHWRIT